MKKKKKLEFSLLSNKICNVLGNFKTFLLALLLIILWLISGPFFNFSDTWQLIINTATTIVTFLMVFIIQSTQNRDTEILNLKLNELIKAIKTADNHLFGIETLTEEEINARLKKYKKLLNKRTGK